MNPRRRGSFFDDFFGFDFDKDFEDMQKRMNGLMRDAMTGDGRPRVYGFSMRVGPDGKPQIQEFGNVPRVGTAKGIKEEREPLVDVIDGKKEISVIAEIPGVEKEDVKLNAGRDFLEITVDTPHRKYHKQIKLPEIKGDSARATYKNGVLEVKLERVQPKKTEEKSKEIKVE